MSRLPILIAVGMLGAWAALGPAPAALVYDRAAVLDGEWWRLVSAHFAHSDGAHLAWNLAAFGVIAFALREELARRWTRVLAAGVLGVGTYLVVTPQLAYYCGLSGLLNTVLAVGLVERIRCGQQRALAVAVLAAAAIKIAVEASTGNALFTHTAWASVPMAHLFGLVAGLLAAAPAAVRARLTAQLKEVHA